MRRILGIFLFRKSLKIVAGIVWCVIIPGERAKGRTTGAAINKLRFLWFWCLAAQARQGERSCAYEDKREYFGTRGCYYCCD
jgi:hypothetical protein